MRQSKSRAVLWPAFLLLQLIFLTSCSLFKEDFNEYDFAMLSFPFAQPSHIARMAAFGIPNWSGSEPHNGIDLIIQQSLSSTRIISPTMGTIKKIEISENPYSNPVGQLILTINIYVNSEWEVNLILEPGTNNPNTKTAQRNAVLVKEKQTVVPGEPIADLLVGELGYPHLHYMLNRANTAVCAYIYSTQQARNIFNEIVRTRPENYLPDSHICFGEAY